MKKIFAIVLIAAIALSSMYIPCFAVESTPFKEMFIPGTIQMVDFDNGGYGVAYAKDGNNTGNLEYRPGESPTIQEKGGDLVLSILDGWYKYTVTAKKSGYYKPIFRYVATASAGFTLTIDDVEYFSLRLPSTGKSWSDDLKGYEFNPVYLEAGTHVIKVAYSGYLVSHSLTFEESKGSTDYVETKEGAYKTAILPTLIEAENFDYDGNVSNDGKNNGGAYRKDDAVDIITKDGGGYYISMVGGESTKYTFEVPIAGAYDYWINAAGATTLSTYFDEVKTPLDVRFDGGISFELKKAGTIYLEKGTHFINLCPQTLLNIDYFKFTRSDEEYLTLDTLDEYAQIKAAEEEKKNEPNPVQEELFVSTSGADTNDGSKENPFKTLEAAKAYVNKISKDMTGDIVVNIEPGYYPIEKTIRFSKEDSGKNDFNIIYRGTDSENPPIFSGGTQITGWTKHDDYLYKAKTNIKDFRSMYVNDYPAQRARSKYRYVSIDNYIDPKSEYKDSFGYAGDGLIVSSKDFPPTLSNPQELELVFDVAWVDQRMPVKDFRSGEGDTAIFEMDQPFWAHMQSRASNETKAVKGRDFYIENAFELLDEPGEFYFNKKEGVVYYYPFPQENMETAKVYAGTTEVLFELYGDNTENMIENITFDNIAVKYSSWVSLNGRSYVTNQADQVYDEMRPDEGDGGEIPPFAAMVEFAKNINFENCEFSCMGTGAISMRTGVSYSDIVGNIFRDIGGTAIMIGSWDNDMDCEADGMAQCHDILVENNALRRIGIDLRASCAIAVYYERNINIFHNDIRETSYSGMTIGWGWGEEVDFGNIKMSYNYISDILSRPLFDGGFIYTLGPMKETEISYNYFNGSRHERYGGIYNDSGSAYISMFENVVENSGIWYMGGLYGTFELKKHHNYSDTEAVGGIVVGDITDHTLVTDGNWPAPARIIMAEAGLEDDYKHLADGLELPAWRTNFMLETPMDRFVSKAGGGWKEAEDWIEGGEGVAWHKKPGGAYTEPKLWELGTGLVVIGTTAPGEWVKYEIDILKDGPYLVEINTSNAGVLKEAQGGLNFYVDDVLVIEDAKVPWTDSWQVHNDSRIGTVDMTAGKHTIKMEFTRNATSINAFRFVDPDTAERMKYAQFSEDYDEIGIVSWEEKAESWCKFSDLDNHWSKAEVTLAEKTGIVKGISDTEFAPDNDVTKEQAIWLSMRAAGLSYNESDWQNDAFKYGIIDRFGEYGAYATREQFTDYVIKAYKAAKGGNNMADTSGVFADEQNIESKYLANVLFAYDLGIVEGDENKNFNPKQTLTRAEAAAIVYRMSEKE